MIELEVGDWVVLSRGNTVVDGYVTGWLVAGGEVVHLFVEEIENPFKLIGENPWRVGKEATDEIQPE
jgi:hypothetical protein